MRGLEKKEKGERKKERKKKKKDEKREKKKLLAASWIKCVRFRGESSIPSSNN